MQNEKIYVGNGKEINTQYGPLLKLSFSAQELQQMLSMVNEKGYINLNVNRRQQPSQYGHTHSIVVDTWKPQQQQQQYQQQPQTPPAYTGNMGQPQQFQQPPAVAPQMQQVQQPQFQQPAQPQQNQQGNNGETIPF